MKDNLGFTRFEFYFVIFVIGIIILIGTHRYVKLTDETRRFSFDIIARNFNSAVYVHHARWIIAQQKQATDTLVIEGVNIQFSAQGWPLAVVGSDAVAGVVSLKGCFSLWNNFLQNPPAISFRDGDPYGSRSYHLRVSPEGNCRFELIEDQSNEFYFEYSPLSGKVSSHSVPPLKNN